MFQASNYLKELLLILKIFLAQPPILISGSQQNCKNLVHFPSFLPNSIQQGLQVSSKTIKKTIRAYPEETSRDFILEAILQSYYEGDSSEEQESDNESNRKIFLGDDADGPPPNIKHPDTPRYKIIKFLDDEEHPSSSRMFDEDNEMYNDLTPQWLKRGGTAPAFSNLNATFSCNMCYSRKPGEIKNFKAFSCVHTICHDCLLEKFQEMKRNNEHVWRFSY